MTLLRTRECGLGEESVRVVMRYIPTAKSIQNLGQSVDGKPKAYCPVFKGIEFISMLKRLHNEEAEHYKGS
jgi:hypothetical protein